MRLIQISLFLLIAGFSHAVGDRPNIVWIVVEDMSAHFGCYGETAIQTPQVDKLASEGVLFENAFVTCPVCSPSRSAMITGMYQTTIGAHQHRSGRGEVRIQLPKGVRTLPDLFKEAGYFVTNSAAKIHPKRPEAIGKTDYNFETSDGLYNGNDWGKRKEGQPFFAQYQLSGGKNRKVRSGNQLAPDLLVKPEDVKLPPYYPDDLVLREDWADYLASVRMTDHEVGKILQEIQEAGVKDSTVVFFLTDHGISHARGKQFCYDEGIRIPFIVRAPGALPAGERRKELIAHIDMSATSLEFAGIPIPEGMQGRPLFGDKALPREFVVSARDRCDETMERIRSVRTDRFKYIRNFHPERPHLQPNVYKDHKAVVARIRELGAEGKLSPLQATLVAATRPMEELYDLGADPWETKNLAKNPEFRNDLRNLRRLLEGWVVASQDKGQTPETPRAYNSDMAEYLKDQRRRNPERAKLIEASISQQKKWLAEGK